VALEPLAQGYAQFGYRWHAQYKPTSTLEIGPADGMGSSELLNPNPLLRLAEQRGTSVRYLAVGFGAGERGPTRFFEDSVAIPGVRLLERFEIGAGVGRALESVDADRRQHAHGARLFGIFDLLLRRATEGPSTPLEANEMRADEDGEER